MVETLHKMVSNSSFHIRLFCSALTQTSFHNHDWQCKVQRSLAVESSTQQLNEAYTPCLHVLRIANQLISSFAGTWLQCSRRLQCRKPQFLARILWLHPLLQITWPLCCNYVIIESKALNCPEQISKRFIIYSIDRLSTRQHNDDDDDHGDNLFLMWLSSFSLWSIVSITTQAEVIYCS